MKAHSYNMTLTWTGNTGQGTSAYTAYRRDYTLVAIGKPHISGSSDPQFRGDASRYNPEELLVSSLSACHMLWYLHLCAESGVVVTAYLDEAEGHMGIREDGITAFQQVILKPVVTVKHATMVAQAETLHQQAHTRCFIASSVNFPVYHRFRIQSEQA